MRKFLILFLIFNSICYAQKPSNERDTLLVTNSYWSIDSVKFETVYLKIKSYKLSENFEDLVTIVIENCSSSNMADRIYGYELNVVKQENHEFLMIISPQRLATINEKLHGLVFIKNKPIYCFGETFEGLFIESFTANNIVIEYHKPISGNFENPIELFDETFATKGKIEINNFKITYYLETFKKLKASNSKP
jgi:hypothetical protein